MRIPWMQPFFCKATNSKLINLALGPIAFKEMSPYNIQNEPVLFSLRMNISHKKTSPGITKENHTFRPKLIWNC